MKKKNKGSPNRGARDMTLQSSFYGVTSQNSKIKVIGER